MPNPHPVGAQILRDQKATTPNPVGAQILRDQSHPKTVGAQILGDQTRLFATNRPGNPGSHKTPNPVGAQILRDLSSTMPPIARETRAPTNASYFNCQPNLYRPGNPGSHKPTNPVGTHILGAYSGLCK